MYDPPSGSHLNELQLPDLERKAEFLDRGTLSHDWVHSMNFLPRIVPCQTTLLSLTGPLPHIALLQKDVCNRGTSDTRGAECKDATSVSHHVSELPRQ